ncbi:peptidase MA family metallohydrolase, partial [Chloroflexota bacterium]
FPDRITFSLEGTSNPAVKAILLKYGSDKRSLVAEVYTIVPEYQEGTEINTSWDWEMKKTGSLPPGATVWWQWEITDKEGRTTTTPKQSRTYQDTRFQWQATRLDTIDIYWHRQSEALKEELTAELESKLARIQLNSTIPAERNPKVFVYNNSEQLRGAILHEQKWTGAVAYPDYNIILTAVDINSLDWAKRALPHEITHLLVGEFTFGPFGDIPRWLNEGLAMYSEGTITESEFQRLDKASKEDKLISVTSLSSSFPTNREQASLAYAESGSIVAFLIDDFGWAKMRQLLLVFKEGSTYDNALQEVYGFDMNGLETHWKEYLREST